MRDTEALGFVRLQYGSVCEVIHKSVMKVKCAARLSRFALLHRDAMRPNWLNEILVSKRISTPYIGSQGVDFKCANMLQGGLFGSTVEHLHRTG